MLDVINNFAWVGGNLLVGYIAFAVVAFVIGYYVFFDPKATTAGKMIFRFMLSLVGVVVLVFIGVFIDPTAERAWFTHSPDVEPWRPLLRLTVYGYVAYTITTLGIALVARNWFPHKVKKKSDLDLVSPRRDTNPIRQVE